MLDDLGNELSYDALKAETDVLGERIGKRCLVFSYAGMFKYGEGDDDHMYVFLTDEAISDEVKKYASAKRD